MITKKSKIRKSLIIILAMIMVFSALSVRLENSLQLNFKPTLKASAESDSKGKYKFPLPVIENKR